MIKTALDDGQPVANDLYRWARRILTAPLGAQILSWLHFMKVQKPGESSETYTWRK